MESYHDIKTRIGEGCPVSTRVLVCQYVQGLGVGRRRDLPREQVLAGDLVPVELAVDLVAPHHDAELRLRAGEDAFRLRVSVPVDGRRKWEDKEESDQ